MCIYCRHCCRYCVLHYISLYAGANASRAKASPNSWGLWACSKATVPGQLKYSTLQRMEGSSGVCGKAYAIPHYSRDFASCGDEIIEKGKTLSMESKNLNSLSSFTGMNQQRIIDQGIYVQEMCDRIASSPQQNPPSFAIDSRATSAAYVRTHLELYTYVRTYCMSSQCQLTSVQS